MTLLNVVLCALLLASCMGARNRTKPACKLYSVPCNDGVGCYSISDMCDGLAKCQDGTDERRCNLQTSKPTNTGSLPTGTVCPSGVVCTDANKNKICLAESDICDGIQQCREGFDESSCPSHRNPYIIPTIISLTTVLAIIIIMCVMYKLCIYRYSSRAHHNSCSTFFFKKSQSDAHLELPQTETSHCKEVVSQQRDDKVYVPIVETREQCVQYPSSNGYHGYNAQNSDYHGNNAQDNGYHGNNTQDNGYDGVNGYDDDTSSDNACDQENLQMCVSTI